MVTLRPGTTLGSYVIEAPLGSGGMGVVYRARDAKLQRVVAIKFLADVSSGVDDERVLREARAASALNHPHVCTVFEVGEADGHAFIVMELVEGQPLSAMVRRNGLAWPDVVRYGVQVADALAHAHERGVIHRDLKAANIIVTPDGRTKVLDFGLAVRVSDDALSDATRSAPGGLTGTLTHLAPEVVRGGAADARSDVWALGVVLYQMATGRLPFDRATSYELITTIVQDDPAPVDARIPEGLRAVIARCLEKEPARRYQRASEVRAALEVSLGEAATSGSSGDAERRARAGWKVAVIVAALAIAVAGVTLRRRAPGSSAPARITSLAVLPLANFSHDPDQDYFVDGMTEAITADLAQIKGLRVISRTSAMRYKGSPKSVPQIARDLGVDALVEGSALRSADRVRITVQLIRAGTDEHMWAESYDRDLRDVLALQGEVARAVARAIQLTLSPNEEARLARARPVSPAAHEAYLKGRYYFNERTGNSLAKAIEYFQEAVQTDPDYAAAHAGLAASYFLMSNGDIAGQPPRDLVPKAKAAATRALELDESLAEAHAPLAYVKLQFDWDWSGADREFRRAIELDPNYPTAHFWYGVCLAAAGRTDEAIAEVRRAQQLDPVGPIINAGVAWIYHFARQDDEAIAYARKTLDLQPNFPIGLLRLGVAYKRQSRFDEAVRTLKQATAASNSAPGTVAQLAAAYALAGNRTEAGVELDRLLEMWRNGSAASYNIALVYTALGDPDRAFAWLDRAYDERANTLAFLAVEPDFDGLRSDPRFAALVRRIGLLR